MCWNLLSALQKNHLDNGIVGNFLPVFGKAVISGFIYLLKQQNSENIQKEDKVMASLLR